MAVSSIFPVVHGRSKEREHCTYVFHPCKFLVGTLVLIHCAWGHHHWTKLWLAIVNIIIGVLEVGDTVVDARVAAAIGGALSSSTLGAGGRAWDRLRRS